MFIPLKTDKRERIPIIITESLAVNNDIIEETLHVFDGQYTASNLIANKVYELLKYGTGSKCVVDVSKFTFPSKFVEVEIIADSLMSTRASLIGFTNENTLKIIVSVSKFDRNLDEEYCINSIRSAIIHELTHGNIYLTRYEKEGDIVEDTPSYYNNIISILREGNCDDVYYFAYALYSTYYHEVQAMVSQTAFDVSRQIPKGTEITNDIIKEAFKKTNTYQVYSSNLRIVSKIKQMNNDERNIFLNKLSERGITIKLEKTLTKIEITSKSALKDAAANAMLVFDI